MRLIGLAPWDWKGDPAWWTEAGFDGWLRKPVEPDRLVDLLSGASGAEPAAAPDRRGR